MNETTQQNAALVEKATWGSLSMKDQAKELISQIEVFVVNSAGTQSPTRHTGSSVKAGAAVPNSALKKPGFSSKPGAPRSR